MGRELAAVKDDACKKTGKMNSLVESLSTTYTDSVKESLRNYEFNFVICDPRLPENPIVYASEGFCKMSGYSREEVLGRNCRFLQGPGTDRRTVLELRDAVREERSAQVRILNYTKEGKPFWNLFHLAPVFSKSDGTVTHFVGVQTPISCHLATSVPEQGTFPLNLSSEPAQSLPSAVEELPDLHKNTELDIWSAGPPRADSGDHGFNGLSNCWSNSADRVSLDGGETGADHAVATNLTNRG